MNEERTTPLRERRIEGTWFGVHHHPHVHRIVPGADLGLLRAFRLARVSHSVPWTTGCNMPRMAGSGRAIVGVRRRAEVGVLFDRPIRCCSRGRSRARRRGSRRSSGRRGHAPSARATAAPSTRPAAAAARRRACAPRSSAGPAPAPRFPAAVRRAPSTAACGQRGRTAPAHPDHRLINSSGSILPVHLGVPRLVDLDLLSDKPMSKESGGGSFRLARLMCCDAQSPSGDRRWARSFSIAVVEQDRERALMIVDGLRDAGDYDDHRHRRRDRPRAPARGARARRRADRPREPRPRRARRADPRLDARPTGRWRCSSTAPTTG